MVEPREGGRTVVLGQSVSYCWKVTTEGSREMVAALSGFERHSPRRLLVYRLAEPVRNLNPTTISSEPYFPHGETTCSGCS